MASVGEGRVKGGRRSAACNTQPHERVRFIGAGERPGAAKESALMCSRHNIVVTLTGAGR